MDLLATFGDYSLQCDLLETVFRLYPYLIKSKDLKYSILPEMPELSAALSTGKPAHFIVFYLYYNVGVL